MFARKRGEMLLRTMIDAFPRHECMTQWDFCGVMLPEMKSARRCHEQENEK